MRFGPAPLDQALGGVLAHGLMAGRRRLRKGIVLGAEEIAALRAAGLAEVTVARLEPGDVPENAAARRLAQALAADPAAGLEVSNAFTGRVNLRARAVGVVQVDAARVQAINLHDAGVTLATVAPWARVAAGGLAATVKIIPYAVPEAALAGAEALASGALRLHPVAMRTAGLILTETPGQGEKLAAKGQRAIEARLRRLGMSLAGVRRVAHDTGAIAEALRAAPGDIVLILAGSATSDSRDAAPMALVAAGGRVEWFGLPVDPGNLTFWGWQERGGRAPRPVMGLPGSARSLVASGVDLVLERLVCGVSISREDIAAMAVGGLGRDVPSRGQPREAE
jgi:molybdenum cofactor cytidylyltransferase